VIPNKSHTLFDQFFSSVVEGCIHVYVSNPVTTTIFIIIIIIIIMSSS